jgi:hypothetical protein
MLGARVLLASGGGSASAETLPHRPRCMASRHARLLGGVRLRAVRPTSSETHLATKRALDGARTNTLATVRRSAASRRPTKHGGEDGMARDGAFLKASAGGCAPSRSAAGSISPSTETTETPRTRTVQSETLGGFAPAAAVMYSRVRNIYYPSRPKTHGTYGFAPCVAAARPTAIPRDWRRTEVGFAPTRFTGFTNVGFAPVGRFQSAPDRHRYRRQGRT